MRQSRNLILLWLASILIGCGGGSGEDVPIQATMEIADGNDQSAPVGTELPKSIGVRVVDQYRRPVSGLLVVFRVKTGNGSVFVGSSITQANGIARDRWILGTGAGIQTLDALSVDPTGAALHAVIEAVATPADAAAARVVSDQLSAMQGESFPIGIELSDRYGNPVPHAAVTFSADNGGRPSTDSATSDTAGIVRLTWTLGVPLGDQHLNVTLPGGTSVLVTAVATQAPPGEPAAIVQIDGDGQTSLQHEKLARPIQVRVIDRFGNGVPGVNLTFSAKAMTGSILTTSAMTGLDGIATWNGYLHLAGTWNIQASVATFSSPEFIIAVTENGGLYDGVYDLLDAACYPKTSGLIEITLKDNKWIRSNSKDMLLTSGTVDPANGTTSFGLFGGGAFGSFSYSGKINVDNSSGLASASGTFEPDCSGSRGTWTASRR